MLTITNKDSNYLARIVEMKNPTKHPNADKLQIWNVGGYDVITDLSRQEGDICVYFAPETQLHHDIVSKLNLYSTKELNADQTQVGYINDKRRVKAVKLRGIVSEGMVLPADEVFLTLVENWRTGYDMSTAIGQEFDTVDNILICEKYAPPQVFGGRQVTGDSKVKRPKVNEFLIPGQFNLHYGTSKLQDNIWKFNNPDDIVVITDKWHGTSAVFSNVLTKRKLSIWEKVKKFFGSNIPTVEYTPMYSSRTVIKSIDGKYNVPDGGYYNSDIWGKVFQDLKPILFKGYTLYGEIVGYTGEKMIQKGYHYGCKPGEHKFKIYRITETHTDGEVYEYAFHEIEDFCKTHGLMTVPLFYRGTIKEFQNRINPKETFLNNLKAVYFEKMCAYNEDQVPSEGICIRNESDNKIAYKLKSKLFLEKESKDLDTATEVIE